MSLSTTEYNAIRVLADGTIQLQPMSESRSFDSVAISPDGKIIATGGPEGVQIWDVSSGKMLDEAQNDSDQGRPEVERRIRGLEFAPNGKRLIAASGAGIFRWSVNLQLAANLHPKHLFLARCGGVSGVTQEEAAGINSISYSPDSRFVDSASEDGRVRLWDTDGPLPWPITRSIEIGKPVKCIAFASSGRLFAVSGSGWLDVRLCDSDTGKEIRRFEDRSKGGAYAVAFSPSGVLLATAGVDEYITIWHVINEQKTMTINRTNHKRVDQEAKP